MNKGFAIIFSIFLMFSMVPAEVLAQNNEEGPNILLQGLLGAGVGAAASSGSGGKAGKGALIGAGTSILGNALLDSISNKPSSSSSSRRVQQQQVVQQPVYYQQQQPVQYQQQQRYAAPRADTRSSGIYDQDSYNRGYEEGYRAGYRDAAIDLQNSNR